MYGLPSNFDASAFVGTELVQISFTSNTVHFVFEPDIQLTIEASFIIQPNSDMPPVEDLPPVKTSCVMTLIGKKVHSAKGSTNGTLTLQFEGGGTIICLDDSENYESYKILIRGNEIVV